MTSYFDLRDVNHFLSRARGQTKKEHVKVSGYVNNVKNSTEDDANFVSSVEANRFINRQMTPRIGRTQGERALGKYVVFATAQDSDM
jgi:hypothetical protein